MFDNEIGEIGLEIPAGNETSDIFDHCPLFSLLDNPKQSPQVNDVTNDCHCPWIGFRETGTSTSHFSQDSRNTAVTASAVGSIMSTVVGDDGVENSHPLEIAGTDPLMQVKHDDARAISRSAYSSESTSRAVFPSSSISNQDDEEEINRYPFIMFQKYQPELQVYHSIDTEKAVATQLWQPTTKVPRDENNYCACMPITLTQNNDRKKKRKLAGPRKPQRRFTANLIYNQLNQMYSKHVSLTPEMRKKVLKEKPHFSNHYDETPLTTNVARKVEALDPITSERVYLFESCSDASRRMKINRTKLSRTCRSGGGKLGASPGLIYRYLEFVETTLGVGK